MSAATALRACIAIPARDEAERLPHCLSAIARQLGSARAGVDLHEVGVLVLANNCRDATAAIAERLAPRMPFPMRVRECRLPAASATAGHARGRALEGAASWLRAAGGPGAALISTDADAQAEPGWLAALLGGLGAGADAVAGTFAADRAEAAVLPPALRDRERDERAYAQQLEEMAARVDPDPHDPWPRHGVHSGASFALTLDAWDRVGGLPAVPVGEDRALFAALRRIDARIRHLNTARVVVSCRLEGRARGGMAATLRHRLSDPEAPVDVALEPALARLFRLRCRRALRRLWAGEGRSGDPWRLALGMGVPRTLLLRAARAAHFGAAWEAVEAAAPALGRTAPMSPARLPLEAARAAVILAGLRGLDRLATTRADMEAQQQAMAG